jgi:hypothetical protein
MQARTSLLASLVLRATPKHVHRHFDEAGVGSHQPAGEPSQEEHADHMIDSQLDVDGFRQLTTPSAPTKRLLEEGPAMPDDPFATETTQGRILGHLARHA